MKAAKWYGKKDIRIEDVPEPYPQKGQVKVKVHWCGICGSDLHEYLAGPIFIPQEKEHPITKEKAPVILGHEFSGEITEIGEGVTHLKPGDRVVVEPIISCNECDQCAIGHYNLCTSLGFHGLAGGGGGFSEYTVFPEVFVHKLHDRLSYEEGALVEPVAVAVHSVRQSKLQQGNSAIVFGSGPIGLATIQAVRAAGAKDIIAVEVSKKRKEYAKAFGASVVLDPTEVNVPLEAMKAIGDKGLDVAFETVGKQSTLIDAINSVKASGRIVITSIWEKEIKINPNLIVFTEKELIGTIAYRHVFPATMELMADKRISTNGWITKKITLDQLVENGFEELLKNKDEHVKILVTPLK